eukprot:6179569-Pleurochrysis_carterae.AAC.2
MLHKGVIRLALHLERALCSRADSSGDESFRLAVLVASSARGRASRGAACAHALASREQRSALPCASGARPGSLMLAVIHSSLTND